MKLNNGTVHYDWFSIALHWLTAAAVFGLFGLGYWMVDLDYYSEWYRKAPALHKSIGITLLLLWVIRVCWRIKQGKPNALPSHKPWESRSAGLVHQLLYLLMLIVMLSGYLISTADGRGIEVFDLFTVPSLGELFTNQEDVAGSVHEWLAYSILAAAILHAFAALKHHFINKDQTLIRILRR